MFVDGSQVNGNYTQERQSGRLDNGCWERSGWAWQTQGGRLFVGVGSFEAVVECQVSAVTGAPSPEEGGLCLDPLRLMTFDANGLFSVT